MRKFLFAILLTLAVSVFPACGDNIPQGLPERFFLGLASHPDELDWMVRSGTPWDARYYYFTGGVNTGGSWSVWYPDGNFASTYMESSARNGYLPVITYYQMVKSKPAIGQNEAEQDYNNLNNPETMSAYFADFKLLMQKAKAFGKPVIVHVEPDLWGYMQQRINGADNPSAVSAAVSSSGFKDVKGLPNNLVGFGRALIKLRDLYARNVILATPTSPRAWMSRGSPGGRPAFSKQQATGTWYLPTRPTGMPPTMSTWARIRGATGGTRATRLTRTSPASPSTSPSFHRRRGRG